MPALRATRSGGVVTLTFDSQANRNALSGPMMAEVGAALDRAGANGARVVVLDHVGPAFCAGADLKERTAGTASSPAPLYRRLLDCPLAVVVVVHGAVRAGGLGLLACADIVLATPESTFAAPEVQRGLVPALIAAVCARRVSATALQRYFLTGEVFDGITAAGIGLVTEAVARPDLEAAAASVTTALELASPRAVATTKRVLLDVGRRPLIDELMALERLSEEVFASEDAQEGMQAFLQRRPPTWAAHREK